MITDRPPYYFLHNLLKIMVVDNNPVRSDDLEKVLSHVPFYTVQSATTARKACSYFESQERVHVCIFDFGIADMKDDEFFLLKKYIRHSPFVILTRENSSRKGFLSCQLGVKALVEQNDVFRYDEFVKMLNRHILLNVLNPRYHLHGRDSIDNATDILFDKSPVQVTEWALEMHISDREMRHMWKKKLGANAKIILFLFHLLKNALGYAEDCLQELSIGRELNSNDIIRTDEYRHFEEYFHLHRSMICDYIAFGNVVNFLQE